MGPPCGQPSPQKGAARNGGRRCLCGTLLAADNTARLCGRCHRDQRDQLRTPPSQLRDDFFETDELRAAFESRHIGKVFKAYRHHPRHLQILGKALNQELLGRWLGITQAQVSRLENGRSEQNLETLHHYARVLHLPQDLLWFDLPGQSRLRSTPLSHLEGDAIGIFRDAADLPNAAIVRPPERVLAMTLRTELLSQYELLTDSYRQIDYQAGSRAVYGDVVSHLNRLMAVADDVPSALYSQYVELVGDTAQLAAWLAIDGQDYSAARQFCSTALASAQECEDPTLHAYVLGVMSYIHLHAKRGHEAVRLLDGALRLAESPRLGVNLAVRSWLYEAMAEAQAFAGDRAAGAQALAKAEQIFDAVRSDRVPHWLGFFNAQEHVARLRGRCLVSLADGRAAIPALETACELLPEHYVRERSGTLIDLASASLMEVNRTTRPVEPEAAAGRAQEAWRLALLTDSKRNQHRVQELLPAFRPYADLEIVQALTHSVRGKLEMDDR